MIPSGNDIAFAAQCLKDGKLVAFPTETVYGLGADALNPQAVARIFEVKQRPAFDPLIVHIAELKQLDTLFAAPLDERIYRLAEKFWPGPLTIVHRKSSNVPDIVTSGLDSVGVRMPENTMARELIRLSGTAVAAPSANRFGLLSPTQASHVQKQLVGVDYLLDGGPTQYGIESTVVTFSGQKAVILRPGAITAEQIREVIPDTVMLSQSEPISDLPAPGMLKSHYSPQKPLFIGLPSDEVPEGSGFICFMPRELKVKPVYTLCLTQDGNLYQAAARLFTVLHQMEEDPAIKRIFIEPIEESGLGIAIMDRIKKAAYRFL